MSDSNHDKIQALQKAAHDNWIKGSQALMALDKDVWHNIKNQANIKKTKWYQSGSNIGPKIVKAQSESEKFSAQMNLSNFKSLKKNLEDLQKECKDFWGKHKDAQQESSVKTALKIYEEAAGEGLKALGKIEGSIPILDKLDAQKAVKDAGTAIGIKMK